MKRWIIFILLLISGFLNGQVTIDSIQLKLADSLYQKAGEIYQSQQDSAILLIHKAGKHYKKAKASGSYIGCLNVLTTIYYQRNEYDKYKIAAEFASKEASNLLPENHDEYAMALNNLSSYYSNLGNFEKGISQLKRALRIYKENKVSTDDLAKIYLNIGNTFVKQGDYHEATQYHTQALNLLQDTLDKSIILRHDTVPQNRIAEFRYLLNHSKQAIAWANYRDKEYDLALMHFESSLQAFKKIKGYNSKLVSLDIITALQSIAKIYMLKGKTDLAYKYIKEVIQYHSQNNAFREARSYEILGEIDLEENKIKSATKNFEKALFIFEETAGSKNLPDYARKLTSLAKIKEKTGAIDEAIIYYQKALKVLAPEFLNDDINNNPTEEMLFSKLEALDILKRKGGALWKKYNNTHEQSVLESSYAAYLSGIEIIKAIRQGVVTKEAKNILAEKTVPIYEGAIQSVLKLYKNTQNKSFLLEAFSLAESNKSMLLLEAINEQAALGIMDLSDSLIQREKELRLEIAFFQRQLIESAQKQVDDPMIKKIEKQRFDSKGALSQLTDFFEKTYPRFYQLKYQQSTRSIKECQQFLSVDNQALIEYFYGEESIYGFVVWANGFDYFQIDKHEDITKGIDKFRTSISNVPNEQDVLQNYQDFTSNAFYLYKTLLAPALNQLPENIQSIKIIPDDQLSYIPFDLLLQDRPKNDQPYFDLEHMEYVLEKFAIGYEYSVTLMLKNRQNKKRDYKHNFLAYAPSFKKAITQNFTRSCSGELYDLSCNQKEVSAINQMLGGTAYIDNSALKSSFETEAYDYRIIHMATHACVDENNPLFNKIFLSDDYLSNADLYNTKLTAELVVLSACNTGSGKLVKGEGVLSLARGFAQAGCASSIVTQWSVDDCATSDIMIDFYKNILNGQNKDFALQKAKLNHLKNADQVSTHPYYWAAFVQSGNSDSMSFSSSYLLPIIFFAGLILLAIFLVRKRMI